MNRYKTGGWFRDSHRHYLAAKYGSAGRFGGRKVREYIRGGRADGLPDADFNPKQLKAGIKHEMEHTGNPLVAKEIAKDHLRENPRYYQYLVRMEKKMKKFSPRKAYPAVKFVSREEIPASQRGYAELPGVKIVPREDLAASGRAVIDIGKVERDVVKRVREEKETLFPERTVDMSEVLTPQMVEKLNTEYKLAQAEKFEKERPFSLMPGERGLWKGATVEVPAFKSGTGVLEEPEELALGGQTFLRPVDVVLPKPEFADPRVAAEARAARRVEREQLAKQQEIESTIARAAEEADRMGTLQQFVDSLKNPRFEVPTAGAERQVRREVREKVAEVVEKELPPRELNVELAGLKKAYPGAYEVGAEEGIVAGAVRRERKIAEAKLEAQRPIVEVFSPMDESGYSTFSVETPRALFRREGLKRV